MSSAGNRVANSSATAVLPEAVGPESATTKLPSMPRLWCLRSRLAADIRHVKLPRPFGGRTHMDRRPHELAFFIVLGAALSAAAVVGVAWSAGFGAVGDRLRHVDATWLPIALAAEVLAYLGYVIAYREVARVEDGPSLPHSRALALVATGFGVFVGRGGFAVDLHAFRQEFVDDREARVRVLGLGALEYALLAPAACIVAILMLVDHVHSPGSGLTMPWAVAVPAGGVLALSALRLRERLRGRSGSRRLPDRQLLAPDRARRLRAPLAARRGRCLGRGRGDLSAAQGRRGGCLDLDRHELPRARPTGEVHGRVAPRAPTQEIVAGPARAFDEHFLDEADPGAIPTLGDALHDFDHTLDPIALDLLGPLLRHRRRLRPASRREDEREGAVVADLLDDLDGLVEVCLRLAREAHDQVGRQREIGNRGPHLRGETYVPLSAVRSAHRLQDPGRARLQWQVRVFADRSALGHGLDHRPAEVLWVRAGKTDSFDPLDRVAGAQELAEIGADLRQEVAAERVDVLSE